MNPQTLGCEFFERLHLTKETIRDLRKDYHYFYVPKRTGGRRKISVPNKVLLQVQRQLTKSVLRFLPKSTHAMGFVPRRSIAQHAAIHASQKCVLRLDIEDFFGSTSIERLYSLFREYDWSDDVIDVIVMISRDMNAPGLPQGAATSPWLTNIVNLELDSRLAGLARSFYARYSRYADDITFSFSSAFDRRSNAVRRIISHTKDILGSYDYVLNDSKTAIMPASMRQQVTGLVVNDKPALPRELRRRLRAAEHRHRLGRRMEQVTGPRCGIPMTHHQLKGWQSFRAMTEQVHRADAWKWFDADTPASRLQHTKDLTWALAVIDGVPSRKLGKALADFGPPSPKLVKQVRFSNKVRSQFLQSLSEIDCLIERWQTRNLYEFEGLVFQVGKDRIGGIALGAKPNGGIEVIDTTLATEMAAESDWVRFFQNLYDRGLSRVNWISSECSDGLSSFLKVWIDNGQKRSVEFRRLTEFSRGDRNKIDQACETIWSLWCHLGRRADKRAQRLAWAKLIVEHGGIASEDPFNPS